MQKIKIFKRLILW